MKNDTIENKQVDSIKMRNGGRLPDERQRQFNSIIIAVALIVGVAFDFIMMIYYFVARNMEKAYPYVAQLVIMGVACFFASLGGKEAQPPTVCFGRRIANTDKNTRAFLSRIAWCMLDSLVFAVAITLFDAYADGKVTGSLILDGFIFFCIFTVIESIACEVKVRRYRKYMAKLDAEENNLED